ncbi:hypothetical protein BDN71DRAFT_1454616, partial [Pleurotus eryngii]
IAPPAARQTLQRSLYILIRLSALPLESPRPASDSGPCACDPCYNYTPLDSKIPTLAIAGRSETATGDAVAHRGTSTQVWDGHEGMRKCPTPHTPLLHVSVHASSGSAGRRTLGFFLFVPESASRKEEGGKGSRRERMG